MGSDHIKDVSEASFEADVLNAEQPVLVDFWAPWCGPCRAVAPVLEQLAEEMNGTISICKLNVDQNQGIAYQYQVASIPTYILFKQGQIADRTLGAMPKSAFESFIKRSL